MTSTRTHRLTAAAACMGLVAFGTVAGAASPRTSCPPARVAGLSYLLDVLESGSGAGPSIGYGVAVTVLSGEQLPGVLGTAQQTLEAAGAQGVSTLSTDAPAQIEQLRTDFAVLAAFNKQANTVISSLSGGMLLAANDLGTTIAPFDVTLRQMAGTVAQLQEKSITC